MNSPNPAMKRKLVRLCALLGAFGCLSAFAQAPDPGAKKKEKAPPQPALKEVVATEIPGVIKGGTKIVLLRDGFNATEGVIALNDGSGSVLFTEQDSNRIIKVDPSDKISTFIENTARTTGLTYDPKGRLVGANSRGPASIGVVYPEPKTILAQEFNGVRLSRPNDLIADKKGGFYFSDPVGPDPRFPEPPPGRTSALLYLTPDGKVIKPTEDTLNPNGVQLTADEKTLYVTNGQNIRAYDVQPNGTLTNGRVFAESGGDGLAIDSEGRLYSAVGAVKGIRVIDKTGKILGVIPSGSNPQSVGFAGKDRRTLYIVGQGALYKVQGDMLSQGIKERMK
jgi:gluconolactonase